MTTKTKKANLQRELEKHRGKWVAIKHGKVIASGNTALSVCRQVKDKKDIQLLKKVPTLQRAELLF